MKWNVFKHPFYSNSSAYSHDTTELEGQSCCLWIMLLFLSYIIIWIIVGISSSPRVERSLHTYGSGSLVASGTLASKHILEKGVAHSSPHGSKNCEPPPFATSKDAAGVELEHALIKFTSVTW
ncbi:hypothetical protein NC651_035322 [Populus alba x Populus x berolinensis]|nr:hypothetical protein NC651_035322 [Populus alba x Populus x berolinensis]